MSRDRKTGAEISDVEMDARAKKPATVRFTEVGRSKATWDAELRGISGNTLLREVRKRGALTSRGIDFECDDEDWPPRGDVVVGGMRVVGRWEVLAP